jgi:hypothetical protein
MTPKQFKRYVPVLIKNDIEKLDYQRKENLYVIIDLIYSRNSYFKNKTQKEYGYSQIPFASFQSLLNDNTKIQEDIKFLIENNFIKRHDFYDSNNGKAKGYKISPEYLSKCVGITITNPKINKKIGIEIIEMQKRKEKNLEFQQSKYYKTFKLRYDDAMEFILDSTVKEIKKLSILINYSLTTDEIISIINGEDRSKKHKFRIMNSIACSEFFNIMHRYVYRTVLVNRINDGYLYFKRNETNGRLDTNLTSLPSCLRQFIVTDSTLYSIDLQSSQPFFLCTQILSDDSIEEKEKELYKSLTVSGYTGIGLYEYIMKEYEEEFNKPLSRPKAKELIFKIFYSKINSYSNLKKFFAKLFPTISAYINKKKGKNYNEFAKMLQSVESEVVLDNIMKELEQYNIMPFTIHDSFICRLEEVNQVIQTVTEFMTKEYGVCPRLHVDSLINENVTEAELILEDEDMDYDNIEYFNYEDEIKAENNIAVELINLDE